MFISLLVSLYMQTMYIHLEFKYNIIIFLLEFTIYYLCYLHFYLQIKYLKF